MDTPKLVIVFLLLLITTAAFTQTFSEANYKQIAQEEADSMHVKLHLNADQAKKIAKIEEQFFSGLLNINTSIDSAGIKRKNDLEKLMMEREKSLKKELTSIQWKEYQQHLDALEKTRDEVIRQRRKDRSQ